MTTRLLTLLALLALSSCRESDPQPLELIASDTFYDSSASTIAGGGPAPFVAYSRWDGFSMSLRLLRHDAARPDELELVGEVDLGGTTYAPCLFVSERLAVVCGGSAVTAIDLAGPSLTGTPLPLPATPEALAATGRWVLAGSGSTLTLVDLDQPASATSATAPAPVTAVLATQGVFLAFTTSGWVHVTPDAISPRFEAVSHPVLRNFKAAYADGVEAIVAGPSTALGRSRVVRLDLTSPGTPAVLRSYEMDGEYAFFAWDGGAMSVVAITGAAGMEVHEGYVVREEGGAFSSHGIPLPTSWGGENPIAAHGERLFALGWNAFLFFRVR